MSKMFPYGCTYGTFAFLFMSFMGQLLRVKDSRHVNKDFKGLCDLWVVQEKARGGICQHHGCHGDMPFLYTAGVGILRAFSANMLQTANSAPRPKESSVLLYWDEAAMCFLNPSKCTLWLFNIAMEHGPFIDNLWWFTFIHVHCDFL